jgi:hypothetical protein
LTVIINWAGTAASTVLQGLAWCISLNLSLSIYHSHSINVRVTVTPLATCITIAPSITHCGKRVVRGDTAAQANVANHLVASLDTEARGPSYNHVLQPHTLPFFFPFYQSITQSHTISQSCLSIYLSLFSISITLNLSLSFYQCACYCHSSCHVYNNRS